MASTGLVKRLNLPAGSFRDRGVRFVTASSMRVKAMELSQRKSSAAPLRAPRAAVLKHVRASSDDTAAIGQEQQGWASLAPVLGSVAVACMGAFSFGYHLGVINGPLEQMASELGFAGNTQLQGAVVSSVLAGAAAGSLGGAGLADGLGRKNALIACTLPIALGSLLCGQAGGATALIVGRALVGVGIGLSSGLVPTYISEVSPTRIRGTLGSVNQVVICLGILGALVVNVVLPAEQWRQMMMFALVPAGALAAGMLLSTESPAWLKQKGEIAQAEAAAQKLWGEGYRAELGMAEDEAGDAEVPTSTKAEAQAQGQAAEGVTWTEMLQPGNGRLVFIGCMLFLFQQLSGINAIVYFSSSVFKLAGLQNETLASAAVGIINVLGSVLAAGLMDRAGRKQLLTISFAGMGASMLLLAAGFSLPALEGASGGIALAGTLAYVLSFALGAGPVPALLLPEIFPARIRGRGVSISLATHWVANFGIGQLFLAAVATFSVSAVYLFFALVCVAAIAFVQTRVVETKGLTMQEIEARIQSGP